MKNNSSENGNGSGVDRHDCESGLEKPSDWQDKTVSHEKVTPLSSEEDANHLPGGEPGIRSTSADDTIATLNENGLDDLTLDGLFFSAPDKNEESSSSRSNDTSMLDIAKHRLLTRSEGGFMGLENLKRLTTMTETNNQKYNKPSSIGSTDSSDEEFNSQIESNLSNQLSNSQPLPSARVLKEDEKTLARQLVNMVRKDMGLGFCNENINEVRRQVFSQIANGNFKSCLAIHVHAMDILDMYMNPGGTKSEKMSTSPSDDVENKDDSYESSLSMDLSYYNRMKTIGDLEDRLQKQRMELDRERQVVQYSESGSAQFLNKGTDGSFDIANLKHDLMLERAEKEELQIKLQVLQRRCDEENERLATSHKMDLKNAADSSEKIEFLQSEVEAKTKLISELSEQLRVSESACRLKSEQCETQARDLTLIRKEINEKTIQLERLQELQDQVTQKWAENDALVSKNDSLATEIARLEEAVNAFDKKYESLSISAKKDADLLADLKDNHNNELLEAKSNLANKIDELEALRGQCSESASYITSLLSNVKNLESALQKEKTYNDEILGSKEDQNKICKSLLMSESCFGLVSHYLRGMKKHGASRVLISRIYYNLLGKSIKQLTRFYKEDVRINNALPVLDLFNMGIKQSYQYFRWDLPESSRPLSLSGGGSLSQLIKQECSGILQDLSINNNFEPHDRLSQSYLASFNLFGQPLLSNSKRDKTSGDDGFHANIGLCRVSITTKGILVVNGKYQACIDPNKVYNDLQNRWNGFVDNPIDYVDIQALPDSLDFLEEENQPFFIIPFSNIRNINVFNRFDQVCLIETYPNTKGIPYFFNRGCALFSFTSNDIVSKFLSSYLDYVLQSEFEISKSPLQSGESWESNVGLSKSNSDVHIFSNVVSGVYCMRLLSNNSAEMILRPSELAIKSKTVDEMLLSIIALHDKLNKLEDNEELFRAEIVDDNNKNENNESDPNCLYSLKEFLSSSEDFEVDTATQNSFINNNSILRRESNASHILSIEHFDKVKGPIINSVDPKFLRSVRLSIDHSSRMGRFLSDGVFSSLIASEEETSWKKDDLLFGVRTACIWMHKIFLDDETLQMPLSDIVTLNIAGEEILWVQHNVVLRLTTPSTSIRDYFDKETGQKVKLRQGKEFDCWVEGYRDSEVHDNLSRNFALSLDWVIRLLSESEVAVDSQTPPMVWMLTRCHRGDFLIGMAFQDKAIADEFVRAVHKGMLLVNRVLSSFPARTVPA